MNNSTPYPIFEANSTDTQRQRYFFTSTGNIDKLIQYSHIGQTSLLGISYQHVYNLGFGDYVVEDDDFNDSSISGAGDAKRVFNTVLNSVPSFFYKYPGAALFVSGSDTGDDFFEQCKADHNKCKRACTKYEECRYADRRINLYKKYVNEEYETLITDYELFGQLKREERISIPPPYIVPYVKEESGKYDAVLVRKK